MKNVLYRQQHAKQTTPFTLYLLQAYLHFMSYENIPLSVNETEHRFEINVEGQNAFIEYKKRGKQVYLIHTEVPPSIEGKGVAAALVDKTLHYLQDHHLQLVPLCSYVQQYLKKHPEWNELLAE